MNFFRQVWLACSGFRTYTAFLRLTLRSAILYWTVFSALLGLVAWGNLIHWLQMGYPLIVKKAAPVLPPFSITNGTASSPLPQPHFSNTNQFPIILDFEARVVAPEKLFPTGVIFRKHELKFWSQDGREMVMPWKALPDGTVNEDYLQKLEKVMLRGCLYFYPVIWLGILLAGLLQAVLFTMLAGLLERSMIPRFSFTQLFNIAVFALTPGCVIIAAYVTAGMLRMRLDLIYFACYCFFLVMASGACRSHLGRSEDSAD